MKKLSSIVLGLLFGILLMEMPCRAVESVSLQDMLGAHMDRVMRKSGLILPTRHGEPSTNWFGRVVMDGEDQLPFGINYIQLRDSDGWAEVRDETGALTCEVAPLREDAEFVLGDLFGFVPSEDTSPELRLSHLVSKWLVCHSVEESDEVDLTEEELRVIQEDYARGRKLRTHRLADAPLVVTNLMTTAIAVSADDIELMVEWPSSMTLPYDILELYSSVDLRNWTRYERYDVNTCQNQFEVQIPKISIPGFLEYLPAQHEATCHVITNFSASAFQPGVVYTNRHWNCEHKARAETPAFFGWKALEEVGFSEQWIRDNYPDDAETVIARGYEQWVDDQVGYDLENGYYKLAATVSGWSWPNPQTIRVGEKEIRVYEPGNYSFLLEKGFEYEIETTFPRNEISFSMQDDLADRPAFADAWWDGLFWVGLWSCVGGEYCLIPAYQGHSGHCYWIPTLQGSPDIDHIRENTSMTFTAQLCDFRHMDDVVFTWTCDDENVVISSPYSSTTDIAFRTFPNWRGATLTVSVNIPSAYPSFSSSLLFTYGVNPEPRLNLRLTAPELVFVNDDDRTSRWYRVGISLESPMTTNAVVNIIHSGSTSPRYVKDMEELFSSLPHTIPFHIDSPYRPAVYDLYFACSSPGQGEFHVDCELEDGNVLTATKQYRVIEPLQELVMSERKNPEDVVYNPSRIVPGEPAFLKVDANGPVRDEDIRWSVVEGSATLSNINSRTVSVVTQNTSGRIVVEAAFGRDASIQPRFVLPIVEKRIIPVKAFVVEDEDEGSACSSAQITDMIDYANKVYKQVGIEFELLGYPEIITDSSYSTLFEHPAGSPTGVSSQCLSLFGYGNDLMLHVKKLYFVNQIVNGTTLGFAVRGRNSIVLSKLGVVNYSNVAHELGHLMGLDDIYDMTKGIPTYDIPNVEDEPGFDMFGNLTRDWGIEEGRGFYSRDETRRSIIRNLLMYGYDQRGVDIPSGTVKGFIDKSSPTEGFSCVGAEQIGDE